MRRHPMQAAALTVAMAAIVMACGGSSATPAPTAGATSASSTGSGGVPGVLEDAVTVRFGVFPNVTHAPGLVELADGGQLSKLLPKATIKVEQFSSGTKADTATNYWPVTSEYNLTLEAGMFYMMAKRNNASLNLMVHYDISFQKWNDMDYYYNYEVIYYNVIQHSFKIGCEPIYYISDKFAIFSEFGLLFVMVPNSRKIDTHSSAYNPQTGSYPLVEQNDGRTVILINGGYVGLRFFF